MHTVYSNIKLTMPRFRMSETQRNTVFYEMEVQTRENKWFLSKKYGEFEQLNDNLTKYFHDVPEFPSKAVLSLSFFMFDDHAERDRLGKLQVYMQALTIRPDLTNSQFFVEFLQLEKNSPTLLCRKPVFLGMFSVDPLNIEFSKGVRQFYYDEQLRTFLLITGDMNTISRINSYLTNTKMPWEGEEIPETLLAVGTVECWVSLSQPYKFEKIWAKIYPSQATTMHYCKNRERLMIGLDDGTIDELIVSPRNKYIKYEQSASFKIHEERVTGIYYEPLNRLMYSISEDCTLTTCDMTNYFKMHTITHPNELVTLLVDTTNKRLFIGANEGHIYVYDIGNKTALALFTIITPEDGPIKALSLDLVKNYLFTAGYEAGMICVFDIDKPGKEKLTKQIAVLEGKENPRCLAWVPKRMEVLVGLGNGTVTFWNSLKGHPMFVLRAETEELTQLHYDENSRLLVTASKGKNIKFWEVPETWRDPRTVAREEQEMELQRKVDNALKIKELTKRHAQDSDEDDLAMWHKASSSSGSESADEDN